MKTKIWSTDSAFGANSLRSDTWSGEKVRVHPVVIFRWLTTSECGFCAGRGGLQTLTILSLLLDWLKQMIEFGVLFTDHFRGPTLTSSMNTGRKKKYTRATPSQCYTICERLTPIPVFSPGSALTQKTACQFRLINLPDTLPSADHK